MQGLIYKSTGSWYVVKDAAGKLWNARMKGVFKMDDITSTNPIAVGDRVDFEEENNQESTATITKIHDRLNYIARQSPRAKHQHHIVASNLDQVLLIATLKEPRTSQGFIDRFLVGAEMYHVPAILLFNKMDLLKQKDWERFENMTTTYTHIGYPVMGMSIRENKGMQEVKDMLKDKVSLIAGHSGVGKSTFINAILPEKALRTQDVSGWSGKGLHTTTFAEMYDIPFGGQIIDTPGLREFGLVDIQRQELSGYFPEMRERLKDCQFNNCLHVNEPGCAIKEAVINGEIDEERYVSYINILESINEQKW